MARSGFYTNPSEKKLEVYQNFNGGLNTVTTNDNLGDNELLDLTNIDLGDRGSLKRRNGMVAHITPPVSGKGQGYFRYYKADGTFDEITAVNGKLYKSGVELVISGLTSFQNTKVVEAVQFQQKLYIATGSGLVQYDGTTASLVTAYAPQPLEALYIGTNGLAANPSNFMTDGEALNLRIDGVTFNVRYGVINQAITLTAYISKPTGTTIEYKFERRMTQDLEDAWTLQQDWSTTKTCTFTVTKDGDYQFRVYARVQGSGATPAQYVIPKYKVKPAPDANDVAIDHSTISNCNRILLHWNRLVMYGNSAQPDVIYISHLNNPAYFPIPNTLRFENAKREGLTALVQYRDLIVAFTDSTIQALFGKGPIGTDPYKRVTLNTSVGCIAPYTAKVMKNYITFLSKEGVHILKSVGYTEDKANVEKIDSRIENLISLDKDACAIVNDSQYQLVLPQRQKRFRCYFEQGYTWTKDESTKLDFSNLYEWDGVVYGQSSGNGKVLKYDSTVYSDDGYVYSDIIETKLFDFGQPYHEKKLKELQLLMGVPDTDSNMKVYVYADSAVVLTPDKSNASVDGTGAVVWNTVISPNLKIDSGTRFGSWDIGESSFGAIDTIVKKLRLNGKCRRMKVKIIHDEAVEHNFLGLGSIFKLKKA